MQGGTDLGHYYGGTQMETELMGLIIAHLSRWHCSQSADSVLEEAKRLRLLPTRTDIYGEEHDLSLEELTAPNYAGMDSQLSIMAQYYLRNAQPSPRSNSLSGIGLQRCHDMCTTDTRHSLRSIPNWTPELRVSQQTGALFPAEKLLHCCSVSRLAVGRMVHQKTTRGHDRAAYNVCYDRTGKFVITGADDNTVQFWRAESGVLEESCSEHTAEINHIAANPNRDIMASVANDNKLVCWDLEEKSLGKVIWSYQHTVAFRGVEFNFTMPNLLLANDDVFDIFLFDIGSEGSSDCGLSLRLLRSASYGHSSLPELGNAGTTAALSQGPSEGNPEGTANDGVAGGESITECQFSPTGEYMVGCSSHGRLFVWSLLATSYKHDASTPLQGSRGSHQGVDCSGDERPAETVGLAVDLPDRPASANTLADERAEGICGDVRRPERGGFILEPLHVFGAHQHTIGMIEFSPDGTSFATYGNDNYVKVWRVNHLSKYASLFGNGRLTRDKWWTFMEDYHLRQSPSWPVTFHESCRKFVWTMDSTKILTSLMNCDIGLWHATRFEREDVTTERKVATLRGHWRDVHVLDAHPSFPNIVMSASYDGDVRIWDIPTCSLLARFDTRETRPCTLPWPDNLHILDGQWSPNGCQIALTDSAGQLHFYGVDDPEQFARTRYDQFKRIRGDALNSNVESAGSSVRDTSRTNADLCDYGFNPYPGAYQHAWRNHSLWQLSIAEAQANDNGTSDLTSEPRGSTDAPAMVTAAVWQEQTEGVDMRADHVAAVAWAALGRQARDHEGNQNQENDIILSEDEESSSQSGSDVEGEAYVGEQTTREERARLRAARRDEEGPQRAARNTVRVRAASRGGRSGRRTRSSRRLQAARGEEEAQEVSEDFGADENSGSEPSISDASGDAMAVEDPSLSDMGELEEDEREDDLSDLEEDPLDLEDDQPGRSLEAYAWLQEAKQDPGRFVPQLGALVVYFAAQHLLLLQAENPEATLPAQREGESVEVECQAAEMCQVVDIDFSIQDDSSRSTCADVRLKVTTGESPNNGVVFSVVITAKQRLQKEFVIPQERWDAALGANFRMGQRVQMAHSEDSSGPCRTGQIIEDAYSLANGSEELQDAANPQAVYWERFTVAWDAEDGEQPENSKHSAWELCDAESTAAEREGGRPPGLDDATLITLGECFQQIQADERFAIFQEPPDPTTSFPGRENGRPLYYNNIVALPMSLSIMRARLDQGYYISSSSVAFDAQLTASNAAKFNGARSAIAKLARELRDLIIEALGGPAGLQAVLQINSADLRPDSMVRSLQTELLRAAAAVADEAGAAAADEPVRRAQPAEDLSPASRPRGRSKRKREETIEESSLDMENGGSEPEAALRRSSRRHTAPRRIEEDRESSSDEGHHPTHSRSRAVRSVQTRSQAPQDPPASSLYGLRTRRGNAGNDDESAPRIRIRLRSSAPAAAPETTISNSRARRTNNVRPPRPPAAHTPSRSLRPRGRPVNERSVSEDSNFEAPEELSNANQARDLRRSTRMQSLHTESSAVMEPQSRRSARQGARNVTYLEASDDSDEL